MGMAPKTWLQAERVQRAMTLLAEPGATLDGVARQLGYQKI